MKYVSIKSEYIKSLIKKTSWSKHGYVDNLIDLSRFIEIKPKNYSGAVYFHSLKSKYYKEYLELLKEISYKEYLKEVKKKEKEDDKKKEQEEKVKKEEEKVRQEWIKAGGKV